MGRRLPKSKPSEADSIWRGGAPQHCRRNGKRQKRLSVLSRAQGAPTSRRRYNTLDLASKIVCQGRPCPPLDTPATKPRFHWMLPASGELPLWAPFVRGTLFPFNSLATKPSGFFGFFPTWKKQNENRDAHSAFSLPKRTPSPLKTSVHETKVSMKTFLP